jgi:hypothetical protein
MAILNMRKKIIAVIITIAALLLLTSARQRAVPHPTTTFSGNIVRIFQQNCQSCHHPGGIAPFSLMTYGDAFPWAEQIKFMTKMRQMPPWKAAPGCGEFVAERRLAQSDIDTIASWVDAGAPEGDRNLMPVPLQFDERWSLGQPDMVLSMSKSFTPPVNRDEYRCFSLPATNGVEKWISTIDFRPGDPTTVHHIVVFLDTKGVSASMDRDGNGFQCFGGAVFDGVDLIGAWSPGARPIPVPEGSGVRLPARSRVVMQVHYHPHRAIVVPDRTEMGIYFATGEVTHPMYYEILANTSLAIPAQATNYRVEATAVLEQGIHLISVYPHMHLLGRSMNIDATLPDGTLLCLIQVPQYEFNWQGAYVFKSPVALPAGTRIHVEGRYDNPTDSVVRWGEATTDEMLVAAFGFSVD